MSHRDWRQSVSDILDAVAEIQLFVEDYTFDQFAEDEKTVKAVAANLMILGEAAGNIPKSVRDNNPGVPWQSMRAIRNRLIHVYFSVDRHILWQTVQDELPKLIEPLRRMLAEHRGDQA